MIREVYEWLVGDLETGLVLSGVKGYPKWNTTAQVPPIFGLVLQGWFGADRQPRIGQRQVNVGLSLSLFIFARNEVELCTLLDRLSAWAKTASTAEVNSTRITLTLEDAQRHVPETDAQQEAYGFVVPLEVKWV